jgi:hypothetical protein
MAVDLRALCRVFRGFARWAAIVKRPSESVHLHPRMRVFCGTRPYDRAMTIQ